MSTVSTFGLFMLGFTLFGAIKKIGLVGYAMWFEVTCPAASSRLLHVYRTHSSRCLALGAGIGLPGLVAGGLLVYLGTPVALLAGSVILSPILCLLVYGHSAMYHDKAEAFRGSFGAESRPAMILVAGIVLEFAFLAPLIGQAIAAVLWMRCFGAALVALWPSSSATA